MRNKPWKLLLVLFLLGQIVYAQKSPSKPFVDSLKKSDPELWYVDGLPPMDSVKSKNKNPDNANRKGDKYSGRKTEKESEIDEEFFNRSFEFIQWLFLAILAAAVIYLIVTTKFSNVFNKPTNAPVNEIITEDTKIEDIGSLENINFASQIANAEENKNYRLAVRLYYLWLIKKLDKSRLIVFHINKTNRQYCDEMRGNKYAIEFEKCTHYYNSVWFGEFQIQEEVYQKITNNYKNLLGKYI